MRKAWLACFLLFITLKGIRASSSSSINIQDYYCQFMLCDSSTFRVCEKLHNAPEPLVLAMRSPPTTPSPSLVRVEEIATPNEVCECCVRRDQNPLKIRKIWLETVVKLLEEGSTSTTLKPENRTKINGEKEEIEISSTATTNTSKTIQVMGAKENSSAKKDVPILVD